MNPHILSMLVGTFSLGAVHLSITVPITSSSGRISTDFADNMFRMLTTFEPGVKIWYQ